MQRSGKADKRTAGSREWDRVRGAANIAGDERAAGVTGHHKEAGQSVSRQSIKQTLPIPKVTFWLSKHMEDMCWSNCELFTQLV